MKIWIDADACPKAVREVALKASEKRRIPLTFVANKFIPTPAIDWTGFGCYCHQMVVTIAACG